MYKKLRIIFTIVSAVFLGLAIPAGIFWEIPGIVGCIIFAGIFFLLMLIFKQKQEKSEEGANAPSYLAPSSKEKNGEKCADEETDGSKKQP